MTAPVRKIAKQIRGGDLIRIMWKPADKIRGRCLDPDCDWTPVGDQIHNISRECMRHTRKYGHDTRTAVVEIVQYQAPRTTP